MPIANGQVIVCTNWPQDQNCSCGDEEHYHIRHHHTGTVRLELEQNLMRQFYEKFIGEVGSLVGGSDLTPVSSFCLLLPHGLHPRLS